MGKFSEQAKYWFGDGEVDVDLMIASGAITLERIIKMYLNEKLDDAKKHELTREEAEIVMRQGQAITHRFFTDDEYLYIQDNKMYSEEGYRFEEGWKDRVGGNWEGGWFIYRGEVNRVTNNKIHEMIAFKRE